MKRIFFLRPLDGTTKGVDEMKVEDFFKECEMTWDKLVGICTDEAPAMLGFRFEFISLVKRTNPNVKGVHCLIHKETPCTLVQGKMVKHVLELFNELKKFLKDHGKHDLLADLNEEGFWERLAYFAYIFEALNYLNRKMQGKNLNIINHVDAIKRFLAIHYIWITGIEKGINVSLSNPCNLVGESDIPEESKADITNHLMDLGIPALI